MGKKPALLIVDVQVRGPSSPEALRTQNDFGDWETDGKPGSLAVQGSSAIIPIILELLDRPYPAVCASIDWHPRGHISFASSHSGHEPFTRLGEQDLWPDHCVQDTHGAQIEHRIDNRLKQLKADGTLVHIVRKGTQKDVDAYSAFASEESPQPDPQKGESSPLADYLHSHGIVEVFVVGLATDYCVKASAMDARRFGFETIVLEDAIRAVGGDEATEKILEALRKQGVKTMRTNDLPNH